MSIKDHTEKEIGEMSCIFKAHRDLPADTVAQLVERLRVKPRACVEILASVRYLICSVAFFLSLLPWRSVGRSNFDWGLQKINNADSNNDIHKCCWLHNCM